MLGAFVATSSLVLAVTTDYDTPAKRLVRYARLSSTRATSPGADPELRGMNEGGVGNGGRAARTRYAFGWVSASPDAGALI